MIHKALSSVVVEENIWGNIEAVVSTVHIGKKKLLLGCLYRPPGSSAEYNARVREAIRVMSNTDAHQTLLCGDFNFKEIDWINHTIKGGPESEQMKFYDACQDAFLHQHITQFTRVRGNDTPSLLDLAFSKSELELEEIHYKAPIGANDHAVILFNFRLESDINVEGTTKWNYLRGNYEGMNQYLTNINWNELLMDKPVEYILQIYKEATEMYIPKFHVQPFSRKPKWMTVSLKRKIEAKEKAWERYIKRKTTHRYQHYCRTRNICTTAVREAKFLFEKDLARETKTNPKAFYAYARSKTTIKEEVTQLEKDDASLTATNQEAGELLNREFQKVFQREEGNVPEITAIFNGTELRLSTFSVNDVKEEMSKLKSPSASGPDGVHPTVLKECCASLAFPLWCIFREFLRTGSVPTDWRLANITPIFKNGRKTDPLNYRPVSLTSVPCKVLEKLIRKDLVEHLESNNILSQHQHGFRARRSCLTQLLEYLEELETTIDERGSVDFVYLDCRKASDTVPHKRLIAKLQALGIRGQLCNWIRGFLQDRRQRVVVKGELSSWRQVWSGVPQGSVLGPVLFLVYVNDILDNLRSNGKLFADDAKIYRKIRTSDDAIILQGDLEKLEEWSLKWLLSFNERKCGVMHVGRENPGHSYTLAGVQLNTTTSEKDLGVTITSDLRPGTHVSKVAAKANQMLGRIRSTFTYMNIEMFKSLYLGLVRPLMGRGDIERLGKIQRRATKLVPELSDLSYEVRLERLGLTTLEERRSRGDMIEVYKILNHYENIDADQFFKVAATTTNTQVQTRGHHMKLIKPQHRTTKRNNFFNARVINQWNSLPESVVAS
ncbi:uncharacterized protein LOC143040877 [Oratosquilla oratoria]|uniref:uncharacterized protein LOC143040877 n=1 Tax=Oratosquilla oratoria TaxID=337810 RepID=UPI003F763E17